MVNGDEDTELFSFNKHKKSMAKVGYISSEEEAEKPKGGIKGTRKTKDMGETEDNLAYIYEEKQKKDQAYKEKVKLAHQEKYAKNKHNDREFDEDYIKAKQFMKKEDQDVLEGMDDL